MNMTVKAFTFNPFQENTYVVYTNEGDAVIIDPGCYEREEKESLSAFIAEKKLNVQALLNTHCHIDHVLGNAYVLETYPVDFYMHKEDLVTLNAVGSYAHLYGFPAYEKSPEPTKFVSDKEVLNFGSLSFQVIFGPGHAPGHVAFYNEKERIFMGGDILFQGSFGRVDLPGGDIEILKKTIHSRVFTLPDETQVYPGHGPSTTVGIEKKNNYILQF